MKIFEALAGKTEKRASKKTVLQDTGKEGRIGAEKYRSGNVTERLGSECRPESDSALLNKSSAVTEELVLPETETMCVQVDFSNSSKRKLHRNTEDKDYVYAQNLQRQGDPRNCQFAVEYEITYIHTNEVIP